MADPAKTRSLIRNAVLIAGPTASGKSAMALALAKRENGVVVNADSMQVYDGLRILTARPSAHELDAAPHRLYGHVPPSQSYSVGAWIADVENLASTGEFAQRMPIFVGGTGLYFRALCEGLADIPPIPEDMRLLWRLRLREKGAERLHATLKKRDAASAVVLRPGDGQRIVRALEVLDATGRSLLDWQAEGGRPLIDHATARRYLVAPARAELAERIDSRFERMIADGAIEEADRLEKLDTALPIMKAIGVRQLLRVRAGELSLEEATAAATAATRQYAKRQATWFRHQLGDDWMRLTLDDVDAT